MKMDQMGLCASCRKTVLLRWVGFIWRCHWCGRQHTGAEVQVAAEAFKARRRKGA